MSWHAASANNSRFIIMWFAILTALPATVLGSRQGITEMSGHACKGELLSLYYAAGIHVYTPSESFEEHLPHLVLALQHDFFSSPLVQPSDVNTVECDRVGWLKARLQGFASSSSS